MDINIPFYTFSSSVKHSLPATGTRPAAGMRPPSRQISVSSLLLDTRLFIPSQLTFLPNSFTSLLLGPSAPNSAIYISPLQPPRSINYHKLITILHYLQVASHGQRITTEHRGDLGLIESFLHEIQRHINFTSISFPHTCTKEKAKFRGYDLPQDALIYANFYSAHMDPGKLPSDKIWRCSAKYILRYGTKYDFAKVMSLFKMNGTIKFLDHKSIDLDTKLIILSSSALNVTAKHVYFAN